jgi:hypothetical protein
VVGLIENNRARANRNIKADVNLDVNINVETHVAESFIGIGGIVGVHRGQENQASTQLSSVISRGEMTVEINLPDTEATLVSWIHIGGIAGVMNSVNPINNWISSMNIDFTTNAAVETTPTNIPNPSFDPNQRPSESNPITIPSTADVTTVAVGALIGRSATTLRNSTRLISDNQSITVDAPNLLRVDLELINFQRAATPTVDTSIYSVGTTLVLNSNPITTAFNLLAATDIVNVINSEWVLDNL